MRTRASGSASRAAWHRPKATKSFAGNRSSTSWSVPKPIIACRKWWRAPTGAGRSSTRTSRPRTSSSICLRSHGHARRAPAAFLTVQEGCDKFCSFCVVPYTRGAEASRPVAGVVDEARQLVAAGVVEVTLLGQNVNAYHGPGPDGTEWSLARLIRELARIDGLERIRFTTSHPNDMSDDLVAAFRRHRKAHAVSSPSGAVGVRSGPEGDEPQAHGGRLHAECRQDTPRAPGHCALGRLQSSAFPERRKRTSVRRSISAVRWVTHKPTPSSIRHGREPQPRNAVRSRNRRSRNAFRACRTCCRHSSATSCNPKLVPSCPCCSKKRGRLDGQLAGKSPHMNAVHLRAPGTRLGTIVTARILRAESNSLAGEAVA